MFVWWTHCQPDWVELDFVARCRWLSDLFVCIDTPPYSGSIEYDMLTV